MVVHVLELALEQVSTATPIPWTTSVDERAMKAAGAIIDHFNRQKFIMLGLQDKESGMQPVIPKRVARVLAMETKNGDGVIMPSEISQKHISEKVGSSYPVSKALELIGEAAQLGFGEIDDHTSPHNRRITK